MPTAASSASRACRRHRRRHDGAPAGRRPHAALQRLVEGKYKIERLLGKVGWRGLSRHDLTLERESPSGPAARHLDDEQIVKRFQQEAKTSASWTTRTSSRSTVESEGGPQLLRHEVHRGHSLEDVLDQSSR